MYGPATRSAVASHPFVFTPEAGLLNDELEAPSPLTSVGPTIWSLGGSSALQTRYKPSGKFNPFAEDDAGSEESVVPIDSVALTPEVDVDDKFAAADVIPIKLPSFLYYDINKCKDFDYDDIFFGCGGDPLLEDPIRDVYIPSPASEASTLCSATEGYDTDTTNVDTTFDTTVDTDGNHDLKAFGTEGYSPSSSALPSPVSLESPLVGFENEAPIHVHHEGVSAGHGLGLFDIAPPAVPIERAPMPRIHLQDKTAADVVQDMQQGGLFGPSLLFNNETLIDVEAGPDRQRKIEEAERVKAEFGEEVRMIVRETSHVGVVMAIDLLDEADALDHWAVLMGAGFHP
ncbi:hypothetical protein MD484_g2703, partial [Candolleomyces efflorescens]